jgi:methionine biosynthesis protein MetW
MTVPVSKRDGETKPTPFVRQVLGRSDYRIIGEIVEPKTRVLDLGCGDGELLEWLAAHKGVDARGVEISSAKVQRAIARGVSVYQGDIDEGLADYPDGAFDYVILSQTLQETHRPLKVLLEMLRVGRRVIVAFPNYGHWRVRLSLLFGGRAPKTDLFPYAWYESPNIHFLTVLDFEYLAALENLAIERRYFLSRGRRLTLLPNLLAEVAVYLVSGADRH